MGKNTDAVLRKCRLSSLVSHMDLMLLFLVGTFLFPREDSVTLLTSVDLSCELVLKARKFRIGAEVLLLETVESPMESNLSETRHFFYGKWCSQRKGVPSPGPERWVGSAP